MTDVSGLHLRGRNYYARKRVPDDLRLTMGRLELTKTLGTSDKQEAKRRLWPVLAAWEAMFADLRSGITVLQPANLNGRTVTPEDVEHAPWWHYTAVLERDTVARRQRPTKEHVQATLERVV